MDGGSFAVADRCEESKPDMANRHPRCVYIYDLA